MNTRLSVLSPSVKFLAALALLAVTIGSASAADSTWLNTGNVTWGNATNWSAGVPSSTNNATFNATSFTNPTPGGITIGGIIVGDGATSTGALSFTSGGYTVGAFGIKVNGNGTSAIGQVQMNALSINASQTWTNNGYVTANTTAGLKTGTLATTANSGNVTLTLAGNGTSGTTSTSAIGLNNFNIDIAGIISQGANSTLSLVVQTTGAGLVSLNSANTFSGGLTVKSGAVKFAAATSAGTGTITLGDSIANANNAQLMGHVTGTIANAITIASGSTGTLTIGDMVGASSAVTYSGAVSMLNNLTIGSYGTGSTTMSGGFAGTGNLTLFSASSGNGTVSITSNPVNMAGSITNSGNGTGITTISSVIGTAVTGVTQNSTTSKLVLIGANTYTGNTTIVAGTLQVGNGGTIGNLSASSAITNNGTLAFNRSNTLTQGADFSSAIAGTGNVIQSGTGTLVITGNNTYTGGTTVTGGTLQLNRATGSLASSSNLTVGGALGGGGKFNVDNTGAAAPLTTALGKLTLDIGDNVLTTTRTADFDQAVTFTSLAARLPGATVRFVNSGSTNSASNGYVLAGVTQNTFIDKGVFFGTGTSIDYAWYGNATASYVRAINYGVDAGSSTNGTTSTLASQTYQQITGDLTAQGNATFTTFNINGNNAVTLAAGTTFQADSILKNGTPGNATITNGTGIKASSGAELVINTASSGDNLIFASPILANGTNALTKAGAGTLTLNGANTYTGTTTIAAGNLTIGSAGTLNGGTYAGAIQNYGVFNYSSSANQTLSGAISGTGSINKTGTANLILSNAASSFSGGVNLNQGTLTYSSGSPTVGIVNNVYKVTAGGLGTGTLTVEGGTSINWTTGVSFAANNMVINGDFTLAGTTAGQRFTMQMPMVLGSATRTATITSNTTAASALTMTGAGTLGIRLANISSSLPNSSVDSGTLRFVGTGNATNSTFSALGFGNNVDFTNNAGLAIGSGVLVSFGGSNLLGSAADKYASLSVESGGYFNMSNTTVSYNQTINSLSGAGIVTNLSTAAGTSILTVAGNGTNTTFSGQILKGSNLNATTGITALGDIALVKSGTGTLTLNGTSTYSGGTTINAGTLRVGSNSALGTGDITGAGGSLQAFGADVALSNNMTLTGTTGLTVSGSQSLTVSGTVTGNGSATKTLINNLDPGKLLTLGNVVINVATGQQALFITGTGNTTVTGVISSGGNTTNVLQVTNTGTTIFTGNNTYNGATSLGNNGVSAGTLQLTGSGTLGGNSTAGLNVFGGTIDLGNKTLGVGALAMGNGTVGTTANILIGSGNLTLNGNVIYSSTVNDNGATISGVGGGLLTMAADRTFTVADSTAAANDLTISAVIANGGGTARALTKAGNGTMLLTAANTYNGTTTISAGTLQLGKQTALYSANNTLWTAANIKVASGGTLALSVGGAGEFTTGNVTTLLANLGGSNGTSTTGFAAGSKIAFDTTGGNFTVSDAIGNSTGTGGGAIGLVKFGSNTLTLSGNNTYSGGTTVNGGKLVLSDLFRSGQTGNFTLSEGTTLGIYDGSGLGAAPSGVIFAGNSTLQFQKSTSGAIGATRRMEIGSGVTATIDTQGFNDLFAAPFTGSGGSLNKIGSGNLTLNGTNTYTGATTITAGTLLINGSTVAGSAFTVNNTGTLGGNGTIGGSVTVNAGGTLSPGNSPGVLNISGPLTLAGNVNMEIASGTRGTNFDGVNLGAGQLLTYGGTLTLTMASAVTNGTYNLFSFTTGSKTGSFSSIAFAGGFYGGTFSQSGDLWTSTVTNSQIFTFNQANGDLIAAVPEPATWALLAFSLTTVVVLRRRRQG